MAVFAVEHPYMELSVNQSVKSSLSLQRVPDCLSPFSNTGTFVVKQQLKLNFFITTK